MPTNFTYVPFTELALRLAVLTDAHSLMTLAENWDFLSCPLSAGSEHTYSAILRDPDFKYQRTALTLLERVVVHDLIVADAVSICSLERGIHIPAWDPSAMEDLAISRFQGADQDRLIEALDSRHLRTWFATQLESATTSANPGLFQHFAKLAPSLPVGWTTTPKKTHESAALEARTMMAAFRRTLEVTEKGTSNTVAEINRLGFGFEKVLWDIWGQIADCSGLNRSQFGPERTLYYFALSASARVPVVVHPDRYPEFSMITSGFTDAYRTVVPRITGALGGGGKETKKMGDMSFVLPPLAAHILRTACRQSRSCIDVATELRSTRNAEGFRRWLRELQSLVLDGSPAAIAQSERMIRDVEKVVTSWKTELDFDVNVRYLQRRINISQIPPIAWAASALDGVTIQDPILNPKPHLLFISQWFK